MNFPDAYRSLRCRRFVRLKRDIFVSCNTRVLQPIRLGTVVPPSTPPSFHSFSAMSGRQYNRGARTETFDFGPTCTAANRDEKRAEKYENSSNNKYARAVIDGRCALSPGLRVRIEIFDEPTPARKFIFVRRFVAIRHN